MNKSKTPYSQAQLNNEGQFIYKQWNKNISIKQTKANKFYLDIKN